MDPSAWTREALRDLVSGRRVMMRATDGANLPVPGWIADAAGEVALEDSSESLDITHPDDRGPLIMAFVEAKDSPSRQSQCQIRVAFDGVWEHQLVTWFNLLDDPDVGGMLCTVEAVEGPAIEAPTASDIRSVHAATNWVTLELTGTGNIAGARGSLVGILGYEIDEIRGRLTTDFIHPDCLAGALENWIALRQHPGQTRTSRQIWLRKDGSEVWLETSFLLYEDESVEMMVVDISERIASEEALAAAQESLEALADDFRLLADEVPLPVFRCDVDGRVEFRNGQWSETFPDQTDATFLHELVHVDEHDHLRQLLDSMVDAVGQAHVLDARAADGHRMLSIRCRTVGRDGAQRRFVGSISDITDTEQLRHQATHDELTGLANRSMITTRLEQAVAEDPLGTLVLFIDLDGFKTVNDTHGHDAGDEVLVEVARRLTSALRPGDDVGRYGGDEFVVVCRGVREHDADVLVERLRHSALELPIAFEGGAWAPRASIGHARPGPDADAATVLRDADQAMFEVKRSRQCARPQATPERAPA